MSISCWVKWHSFSYCLGTKESQKHQAESHDLALKFVADARQTLTDLNRHHDFILNMDQTQILFSLYGKWSLDSQGIHTVDICKSTGIARHATLAVTVTASDGMLPLPNFQENARSPNLV